MTAQVISDIDDRLLAFERAAAASPRVPDLDSFLPSPDDPDRIEAVRELVRVALELRWGRGDRPNLADYLARYPELGEPEARAAIAFEDYRQRILAGDKPSRDSYQAQYGIDVADWPSPDAVTSRRGPTSIETPLPLTLTPQLEVHEQLTVRIFPAGPAEQPSGLQSGDIFLGFKLVRELGRGAFARVFLAEQADLADRPVALKVSALLPGEVRTLARLQHTNIVPVFSVHRSGRFQAVCMPFVGGATLASVLAECTKANRPLSGRAIVDAVAPKSEWTPGAVSSALTYLESASHVDAVLWIGERLADALAHAHERGVIHRDIKPANVLIADDGQPMLLDFNLAQDDNEAERARAGGTFPYMAPEQMAAFGHGPQSVDGRTDVYALGVLLFQLLARQRPFPDYSGPTAVVLTRTLEDRHQPPPRLRPHNPEVTPAVEAIVRKCLEPSVGDRYLSAAALRDDIARHRANLPLRHVREPSIRERASKWMRRHPRLASPSALTAYAAAILLAGSALAAQLTLKSRLDRQHREQLAAFREYEEGQKAKRQAAYMQFEEFLIQADGVKLAAGSLDSSAEVLRRGSAALEQYGVTEPGWEDRDEVARLASAERDRLRSEIGELAFLTARAAANQRRDSEYAARLNALAADALGPAAKPAVAAQRSELTGLTPAEITTALSDDGRGNLLRAYDLAARGRYREALPLADRFVAKNPDDFGAWFLKARCHDELGEFDDARAAYSTCAALRPRSARPLAARGNLLFRHVNDRVQALADLDRALQLDPNLGDARLTRALVLRRMAKNPEALADLDRLAAEPNAPTRIFFVRAQVKVAMGDKDGAAADRAEGMKREPADPASFVTRGLARVTQDMDAALADFRAAEKLDPRYADAMVNQAWLLGEKMNRPAEALEVVDRLLALYPDHQTGRGGRAVYLARLGRNEQAIASIRRYLADAPHPATYYRAACVFAMVSKSDPKYREEAVRLTAIALLRGWGHDFLLTDEDLNAIRDHEQFRKLADGVKVMKDLGSKK
jgi:eukaryotic-like serine/threonine-protein kinase